MHSCLYLGQVRHRRTRPLAHAFTYRLFMVYLDLDELDRVFRGRWLWSTRRANVARFRRADHLGDSDVPLARAVRDLVADATGNRPSGPIRLLTHLRYFGYGFNPVSFYYCFDPAGDRVQTVVAEVNNTPWGEQHCYVLDANQDSGRHRHMRFQMRKAFHVSPFMPMEIDYDWRFSMPSDALSVHMQSHAPAGRVFDATMALRREPITGLSLARVLIQFPAVTLKVTAMIYFQALRLWLKRVPFFTHPDKTDVETHSKEAF